MTHDKFCNAEKLNNTYKNEFGEAFYCQCMRIQAIRKDEREKIEAPIRELHKPFNAFGIQACLLCSGADKRINVYYPCPTIQALEGEGK